MNSNRTFTMLKPDSIEQGNMLPILNMIESSGFKIIALKYKRMSKDEAEKFYSIHSGKPFFNDLVDYMTSGPVMVQVLEGQDAINLNRKLMGATNPEEADEGTIRKDLADSIERNTVHGSDGPDTAAVEIEYFFG